LSRYFLRDLMKKKLLLVIPLALFLFVLSSFQPAGKMQAQTSCQNVPTSTDTITSTFSVPENNTYALWTRLLAPDTSNNSVYIQIDNDCAVNVGDSSSIPANQFTWVNYQDGNSASIITKSLTAGTHTIKLTEREGGVGVDRIIVTTNTSCIPTGTGDNCPLPTNTPAVINTPTPTATVAATNTPVPPQPTSTPLPTLTPTTAPVVDTTRPTVSIASPANGSVVTRGTTTTITANATDNVAVRQVQFSITGKGGNASCTDTTYPYTCSWLVPSKPSTSYSITATATDTSGNTASAAIQVTSSK
jgi:hypothetical protein